MWQHSKQWKQSKHSRQQGPAYTHTKEPMYQFTLASCGELIMDSLCQQFHETWCLRIAFGFVREFAIQQIWWNLQCPIVCNHEICSPSLHSDKKKPEGWLQACPHAFSEMLWRDLPTLRPRMILADGPTSNAAIQGIDINLTTIAACGITIRPEASLISWQSSWLTDLFAVSLQCGKATQWCYLIFFIFNRVPFSIAWFGPKSI